MVGVPTMFVIHTRTEENKDRKYGMDDWKVEVKKCTDGSLLEVQIEDKSNGK